jgi:hypothetical protein
MQILFLSVLTLLAIASPAAALLADLEPSNNSMSTATIQLFPSGAAVGVDGGRLSFSVGGGDIDFIGVGDLIAGDVVTITTTPMVDAPDFEHPDTIAGLFDSTGRDLCIGDDAANNDLDNFPMGFGSLCRLEISADGDYFVGATGYSAIPFDGDHVEEGVYSLTVTITAALPEPGLLLQLASGLLGLVALDKRRRCASRERERRAPTPPVSGSSRSSLTGSCGSPARSAW